MPAQRRRYTKKEKLATVMAAEMSGMTATAEATGIPKSTLQYWMDDPAFAEVRTKTREDLAQEIGTVAHLAWSRVAKALASGEMEPRDAIFAAEKATSLQLLMKGEATSRTETHDWKFDDHETVERAAAVLVEELARRTDESAAEAAVGAAGEAGSDSSTG